MKSIRRPSVFHLLATLLLFLAVAPPLHAEEASYEPLPGEGKTIAISSDYSFVYNFAKKPQLGIVILKVEVADKDGKKDSSLKITGASGMPSMPGHHDSGEVDFKLNDKGDYLLPVDVVMPGGWEIKLVFSKEDKVLYRGSIKFDI
jgi:hypothetical protein